MDKERILENVMNYLSQRETEEPFTKGLSEVPVSGGKLSYFDIINLIDASLDGWMTEGKWADKFRHSVASYTGYRHAVLCNSGSSANLLALSGIKEKWGLNTNDVVVTSALAFSTTVAPIIQSGLIPCFVDINIDTLNPYPETIEMAIRAKNAKGVILAHTLGFPYDAKAIDRICKKHNCFFIQDSCDALGARTSEGQRLSDFGDVSTLSFFPAHQITTGEGGAVLTNDGRLFNVIRSFANWGRDCYCKPGQSNTCGKRFEWEFEGLPKGYDHKYIYSRIGYNLKMTELQAALGVSQMTRIQTVVHDRRFNYMYLKDKLRSIPNFTDIFSTFHNPVLSSPFGFPILVKSVITRKEIVDFLEARKIRTRPIFSGNITRQPMMRPVPYEQIGDLHNCDRIMEDAFWIGCHPELKRDQLDYMVESFSDFLSGRIA